MTNPDVCKLIDDCAPDYENEYYRLTEEVKRLNNENKELKDTLINMCKTLFNHNEV